MRVLEFIFSDFWIFTGTLILVSIICKTFLYGLTIFLASVKRVKDKYPDPVKKCLLYKRHGCEHVDGYLCNYKTCPMSIKYDIQELEQQLDIPHKDRIK